MVLFSSLALSGCGSGVRRDTYTTTVAPLATDDLAGPCVYETPIPVQAVPQTAVLVIFERGDSDDLFLDVSMRKMAASLHMTTVFAHECDAASFNDLQPDASKGPGRALFTALNQFAAMTQHPELATSKVYLFGFSSAGLLSITLTQEYPDRVLGALPFASGSAYLNLFDLGVTPEEARVPMLIMGNAEDQLSGTERSYAFFGKGRALGAPWGFAIQNGTSHCCSLSTRNLIIPWIEAIAAGKGTAATGGGVTSYFICTPDGAPDGLGYEDLSIREASITTPLVNGEDSGWLPNAATADAWLTWVTNPQTN